MGLLLVGQPRRLEQGSTSLLGCVERLGQVGRWRNDDGGRRNSAALVGYSPSSSWLCPCETEFGLGM